MKKLFLSLILSAAAPLFAQTSDEISFQRTFLLRNVAGTSFNPGTTPHHPHLYEREGWTFFREGSIHLTYATETGPRRPENQLFSTNWFAAGAQRTLGSRGLVLFRGRASLEPLTIPEGGYPQLLQWVSEESGGPLRDFMRAQDLVQEASMHVAFRTSTASFLHLYVAPVGNPALGTVPFAQRASSEEFAEAPFTYDVQESFQQATRVVTAGFAFPMLSVEGSIFHHGVSTGRHSAIEDGDIDSWSGRAIFSPLPYLSLQVSQGSLGEAEREVTSVSASLGTRSIAASVIVTQQQDDLAIDRDSLGVELTLRPNRNSFLARVEVVDRPIGLFGEGTPREGYERTTHFTVGYMFDFLARSGYRGGAGVNFDYHTNTHAIEDIYGHKPQSIYLFVRLRSDSARR